MKFKVIVGSGILIAFLAIALLAPLSSDSPSVSQPSQRAHTLIFDAPTWTGGNASPLASNVDNWDNDWVPDTGECVVFYTGAYNCTWDIAKVFSFFYMNASYTGAVTVATNFTVAGMTVASGTLKEISYTITDSGNWDSSGGTFTAGTSTIRMTGAGKTLKTATGGGGPYNLQISGTISTTSNIIIANDLEIDTSKTLTLGTGKTLAVGNEFTLDGTLYQAGNAAEISGGSAYPLQGYGAFDGEIFLDTSPVILHAMIGPTMTGSIHASKNTIISDAQSRDLQFIPDGVQDVNITALTFGDSVAWTSTSTSSVMFTTSGLEAGRMYRVTVDGVWFQTVTASPAGTVTFTFSGPWSQHDFLVTPTAIDSSLSPLVGIIFILMIVGLVVCVVAVPVNALRNKEPITKRTLFDMVFCVVIGLALIGAVFAIIS